jgi:hypothetical protein
VAAGESEIHPDFDAVLNFVQKTFFATARGNLDVRPKASLPLPLAFGRFNLAPAGIARPA